jgi:hypothetical protein
VFLMKGALLVLLTASSNCSSTSNTWSFSSVSGSAGGAAGSANVSIVSCSDTWCSVTLGGTGSTVGIFYTTISFGGIRDGRATLGIDGRDVSCGTGQTVTAGSLTLRCTGVTADTVSFTASPR